MTRKQAFELSIEKWKLIIENEGEEPDDYPSWISKLFHNCGLCEKYLWKSNYPWAFDNCAKWLPICPKSCEYPNSLGCAQPGHQWTLWDDNPCPETAQAVLNLILSKQ